MFDYIIRFNSMHWDWLEQAYVKYIHIGNKEYYMKYIIRLLLNLINIDAGKCFGNTDYTLVYGTSIKKILIDHERWFLG